MLIQDPGGGFIDPMPPIRDPQFPTMPIPPGGFGFPGPLKRPHKPPTFTGPINPIPWPGPGFNDPMPIPGPIDPQPGPGKRFGWPGWPGRRPWNPRPQPIESPWRGPQYVPPRGGARPGPTPIFDPVPQPMPWGPNPPTARPDYRNQPVYGNRGKSGGFYPGRPEPVTPRGILDDVMKLFGG